MSRSAHPPDPYIQGSEWIQKYLLISRRLLQNIQKCGKNTIFYEKIDIKSHGDGGIAQEKHSNRWPPSYIYQWSTHERLDLGMAIIGRELQVIKIFEIFGVIMTKS